MSWNFNPMAGPWLAAHIWEYYGYTRDLNFLKETGYELIKSSADFEVDMIWENNQSKEATVRSGAGGNCVIKYGNKMLSFKTIKGQSYQLKYDVAKRLMKEKTPEKDTRYKNSAFTDVRIFCILY